MSLPLPPWNPPFSLRSYELKVDFRHFYISVQLLTTVEKEENGNVGPVGKRSRSLNIHEETVFVLIADAATLRAPGSLCRRIDSLNLNFATLLNRGLLAGVFFNVPELLPRLSLILARVSVVAAVLPATVALARRWTLSWRRWGFRRRKAKVADGCSCISNA